MTICVSVKTRDGIVLGTDSMSTVTLYEGSEQSVAHKTYSNARKLVQIADLPVGVYTYGLGNLGARTVYSHILEYSRNVPDKIGGQGWNVQDIANGLAQHIGGAYEAMYGELEHKPELGLHIAGYTSGAALPEEWEIELPGQSIPLLTLGREDVGMNWEGIVLPFARLFHGYDARMLQALRAAGVHPEVIQSVIEDTSLVPQVLFDAMPLQDAINYAVYVLRTTIGFTSFEARPPMCGGQLQVAVISEDARFQWVSKPEFRIPEGSNEWV